MSEFVFSAISQKHCISQLIGKTFANCELPVKRYEDKWNVTVVEGAIYIS